MINVWAGGSLHQHVPEHLQLDHPPEKRVHVVKVDPATPFGRRYPGEISVNTYHHQTIDEVGDGLVVVGRAPDGVIEMIEHEQHRMVAVQWHPELLDDLDPAFTWLVDEARRQRSVTRSGPNELVSGPWVDLDLGDAHADITSHDTYVNGVPHATFARLRRDDPVSWWDEADGSGFWAVTRYADVLEVSKAHERFTVTRGIRLEEMSPDETASRRTMMEMDPPEHTRYRRLVSKPFSRKEVYAYEEAIRSLARLVVEETRASGATTLRLRRRHRQAAAHADARSPAGRAGRGRSVAGRAGRRAARQHRPRLHHPSRRPGRHRGVPPDALPQPGRHRPVPLRRGAGPRSGARTRPTT